MHSFSQIVLLCEFVIVPETLILDVKCKEISNENKNKTRRAKF